MLIDYNSNSNYLVFTKRSGAINDDFNKMMQKDKGFDQVLGNSTLLQSSSNFDKTNHFPMGNLNQDDANAKISSIKITPSMYTLYRGMIDEKIKNSWKRHNSPRDIKIDGKELNSKPKRN